MIGRTKPKRLILTFSFSMAFSVILRGLYSASSFLSSETLVILFSIVLANLYQGKAPGFGLAFSGRRLEARLRLFQGLGHAVVLPPAQVESHLAFLGFVVVRDLGEGHVEVDVDRPHQIFDVFLAKTAEQDVRGSFLSDLLDHPLELRGVEFPAVLVQ